MNDKAPEFWQRVKDLIKSQNTTQEWVAKTCSIGIGTFKSWIFNERLPNADEAVKIARALGTTVEYLVTGEESNPYKQKFEELENKIKNLL